MVKRITKSFHGRILLISLMGTILCVLSCGMVFQITIRTVGQNQLADAMNANLDKEMEHLEFCYFTMARMMQQMGENGNIGGMVQDYLDAENNFDKYTRKVELENEIVSVTFINQYVNFASYVDSQTKQELFDNGLLNSQAFGGFTTVKQIGNNKFQAIHRSSSWYNQNSVVSTFQEKQSFGGHELDIYIEMKTNIMDYPVSGDGSFFLSIQLDENGQVLFCNGTQFAAGDAIELPLKDGKSFAGKYQDYYLVARKSNMGYIYVNGVPNSEYQKGIREWYLMLFSLCVLSIIPALLIMLTTKRMLGNPISRLENEIIAVGKGKLELVNENMEIEEFHELMHEINEMKIHIRELIAKVQEEEKQRQKTEREKLMYQINPHFLLNTLNSVQWMAQLDGQRDISRFVTDFKAILAYNLGKEEKNSTLRTEVEIAEKYINLQKQRYDFDASLEVEEGDYLDVETVRMLLQPMIENALRYGLGELGRVDIRIFYDAQRNYAVITIQDYGNGLDREKLEELNRPFQYEGNGKEENAGIGLRYVRHCLEGFYGGEASLTINSEIGKGTKVTILIPTRKAGARRND